MTGLMNTASDGDLVPAPQFCDPAAADTNGAPSAPPLELDPWRDEVAAHLARYRARRKPRAPRYPSLLLPFDSSDTWPRPATAPSQSLATEIHADTNFVFHESARTEDTTAGVLYTEVAEHQSAHAAEPAAKIAKPVAKVKIKIEPETNIIEFPRSAAIPVFQTSTLADPIFDRPRIVEAPEIVPPPPALGGIIIGPAPKPAEIRPEPESRIPSPSIPHRLLATAVDGLILAAALSTFAAVFLRLNPLLLNPLGLNPLRLTPLRGPLLILASVGAGLAIALWFVYQFLFIVYTGSTPGLRATRLQITRFDGSPIPRSLRRWRVIASFLSGLSAGLGYLWCFLDADSLCWHDRITHTHLRSTK
jgi:uncharacterized RDD family membrane protein YckC